MEKAKRAKVTIGIRVDRETRTVLRREARVRKEKLSAYVRRLIDAGRQKAAA